MIKFETKIIPCDSNNDLRKESKEDWISNHASGTLYKTSELGQSGIIIDDEITEILYDLQDIHDTCWVINWHKALYVLALDYELSPDILTQFGDINEYEKISDL